jgi:cytochrome c peroxidase
MRNGKCLTIPSALAWVSAWSLASPLLYGQLAGLSLKGAAVPEPGNLSDFVKDRAAAVALGKALFWDMQIGSDGIVACATCHFYAGADSRTRNQIGPGQLRVNVNYAPWSDRAFDRGPNWTLTAADFPLRLLRNPNDRDSEVLRDSNDVVSSQGVRYAVFNENVAGRPDENARSISDPDGFRIGKLNVRRVEPRNAPSVINAVLNSRNFWDGRAQSEFNGVNHLGALDGNARVYRADAPGDLRAVRVLLDNASLASQAVAPPLSPTEMSAAGRTFADIFDKFGTANKKLGKKLSPLRPLGRQLVHPEDSALGALSRWPLPGLIVPGYAQMIEAAFERAWWQSDLAIRVNKKGEHSIVTKGNQKDDNVFSQIEYNFALFFGLAIQMYEATLVSDDSLFDRAAAVPPTASLNAQQQQGFSLFADSSRVRCINCHAGAAMTDAAASRIVAAGPLRFREGQWIDRGFNNIGVRPTLDDLGVGGADDLGNPLALARRAGMINLAVDGAFKTPGLRNVELTAPYFHNGGVLTLRGVIEFYNRAGDFAPSHGREGPITGLHLGMGLQESEKDALVAFLLTLTDERVRRRRAPFDHPQLFVPDGHEGSSVSVAAGEKGEAKDVLVEIPAIGRHGGPPLRAFLE